MPDITIRVRNRIAEAVGSPEIICGNDGYNAVFDLDEEWAAQEIKTMRVTWTDTFSGNPRHIDVPFSMGFAAIPAIADAYEVQIGIYTGNIMTTTPARIPCVRCITDSGTYHEDPQPETYAALLQLLRDITQGGVTVGDATVVLDGTAAAKVGNAEQRVPFNGWNYWQETNDDVKASSTVTATPTADCLLLACVMHRNENVSIAGDGWTKIVDSVPATYGTDYTQWITVWSKNVQRGQHEVTVEQSASARMSLKTIALYDASALTVVTNSLINDDPYTPPAATGKRRLYLISSISSSSTVDETYIATDTGELDLRKANEKRFIAFYCYEPDKSASLKFKYNLSSFEAGEQNILILDVEEVD